MNPTSTGWIFLAGDYWACIKDTRTLALRHGLIWYSGRPNEAGPHPGDRLLLAFRRERTSFVPLSMFEAMSAAEVNAEWPGPPYSGCVGVIPEDRRAEYLRARPGRGGAGYKEWANRTFRALTVSPIDPFSEYWERSGAGPHDFPAELCFTLSTAPKRSKYLAQFDPEMFAAPIPPGRFHP